MLAKAADARTAGISVIPQVQQAYALGTLLQELEARREAMASVMERGEGLHHDPTAMAKLLTSEGRAAVQEVRSRCDALELRIADSAWPLPKYREMLFPV